MAMGTALVIQPGGGITDVNLEPARLEDLVKG